MTLETLILRGGESIEWRCGSGFADKVPERIAPSGLRVTFDKASVGVRILHKPRATLVWRPDSNRQMISGSASASDLTGAASSKLILTGQISDPSGCYLPRAFAIELGASAEHKISLYHSPLGARLGDGGGIYGSIALESGEIVPWALLQLTVTPPLGAALKFIAQSDNRGEFVLPLDRLPALTKDAPVSSYAARLEVKAVVSATPTVPVDTDQLPAAKVAKGKRNGKNLFADFLELSIVPGSIASVTSPKYEAIVVKPT